MRAARDRAHRHGDHASARELRKQLRGMPSGDPRDPGFRRLHYACYADDTLLGFTGPRVEAEEVKQRLAAFLHDELKLELSQDKTSAVAATSQVAAPPKVHTVTVGSNPVAVVLSGRQSRAYVLNDGSVSVLSLQTHRELASRERGFMTRPRLGSSAGVRRPISGPST